MWGSAGRGRDAAVTCIACGDTVSRSDAREYDKYGDRWERDGKEFEHLCKPCDRERCHQPRGELEALLASIEADLDGRDRDAFLAAYVAWTERPRGSVDD